MRNLILNVGLADKDGIAFGPACAESSIRLLLAMLASAGVPAPNITARGTGQYTADSGKVYKEPCLSLTWYGHGSPDLSCPALDSPVISSVRRVAGAWCALFEQESFSLQTAEVSIIAAPQG